MNLTWKNYLKASIFASLLVIITFQSIGLPFKYEPESSFLYAINYFFAHNIKFYITYGPLGYLYFPLPLKNNVFTALIVNVITRLLLIYNLFLLITKLTQSKHVIYKVIVYGFLVFFSLIDDEWFTLYFLTISFICLYNLNPKNIFLVAAAFFSVLMFLEKPGLSIICFSAAYGYLLLLLLLEKNIKPIIIFTLTSIISYFAFWLILYGSLIGSIDFLFYIPSFSVGNSLAMSINPSNSWGKLSLSFAFFILSCAAFFKRPIWSKDSLFAFAIFLVPTYAIFKYGFSREDGHQIIMENFLALSSIFMIMITDNFKRLLFICVSSILCLGSFYLALFSSHLPSWGGVSLLNINGYKQFESEIFKFNHFQRALRQETYVSLLQGKMPFLMRNEIGNDSVDIYNGMQAMVPANHLNWDPRPVFQTYDSNMPSLDKLNAVFFQSARKPQYLLWAPFNDIDNRYILSTEPMTMYQIFNWYKPIMISPNVYLLKKQDQAQLSKEKYVTTTTAKWGEWIPVPSASNSILRARLKSQLTLFGQIKTAIYKLFDVTVDYRLADNSVITYRLVYPTAVNGVWVNPLLKDPCQVLNLEQSPANSKVIAIRFNHDKYDYFRKKITLDWYGINYLGNAEGKSCQIA